ncbi:MAG: single-stranded-DNA-specific exonuclease RecJ [Clostridiales bacterium]|nr:single-stranded-DNA-specific exonuclease RecJ [Clostridiales bacterium]
MEKWFVYGKKADFAAVSRKFNIDPVIARIIRNRDIIDEEQISRYLEGGLDNLYDPHLMKDIDKAVDILLEKKKEGKKVRVIGDYDIDGVNSLYILLNALKRIGIEVDGEIPHRIKDGYGINESLIQSAFDDGIDTILTCDNGIAAIKQIEYAKELGMTVVITDHHEIFYTGEGEDRMSTLPNADAIVNPKQEDCSYPFKNLCGAGVAFKLAQVLYERTGIEEEIWDFLEYVALATIGDIMDLLDENRILVKEGLKRLKKTKNLGIAALMEVTKVDPSRLSAYHIGFVLGPCLNAGGRLDTAKRAVDLLMSKNKVEAENLAGELKALNDSRKEMTKKGTEEAISLIETSDFKEDKVYVVYLPDCHESLAGIIAGRVREQYHKPVFVLTNAEEGVKGSGRSIETYHMFDELVKAQDLLEKFGGHPMAAGLSMKKENVETFRKTVNDNTDLTEDDFISKIWIDSPMPFHYINEEFIKELELLEPFGKANQKPVFAESGVKVVGSKIVGANENVLKLLLMDKDDFQIEGIYFGDAKGFYEFLQNKSNISILYYPSINEFRGVVSLQVVIQGYC